MNWPILTVGREDWWTSKDGGWATFIVLALLLVLFSARLLLRPRKGNYLASSSSKGTTDDSTNIADGCKSVVTESDLQRILILLGDNEGLDGGPWIQVVDKQSDTLIYNAKQREPEDGTPTEYLSTSIFRNCSTKQLLDFYMDNEYRLNWDNTFESYQCLGINQETGEEIGRFIRRFPFVRPREYVLAWRIWEASDGSFLYCAKHCEHPKAPRSASYTRVEHYFSGWHIRADPDNDCCEIKMFHQEDTSLMAKKAFAYRIWNYMGIMEKSLKKYRKVQQNGELNAVALAKKVPPGLEKRIVVPTATTPIVRKKSVTLFRNRKLCIKQTGKWMASGALVLGAAAICTRSSAPVGAKVAALYAIKKIFKPSASLPQIPQQYAGI